MVFELDMVGVKVIGGALLLFGVAHAFLAALHWLHREPVLQAHFSPKGGCTAAILAELARARKEVLVMAYSFSCPDVAGALVEACRRGVKVMVLLDRSNEAESYSQLGDLEQHKVEVWIDAQHAIAHNKVMIIDRRTVVTGSFNFTRQAEHENAENLLILRDHVALAALYRANFLSHRSHCHPPGAGKAPAPHARPHIQRTA